MNFVGSLLLTGFALRRDRVRSLVWVLVISLSVVSTAASFQSLFPTLADRAQFAVTVTGNAAFEALYGPPYNLTTIGGLTVWRLGGVVTVLTGLMSVLLVVRHTRSEEEEGRMELIGAAAIGRYAALTAALLIVLIANACIAAVTALGCIGVGLPVMGSIIFALAIAGAGCAFGAAGAVCAQLASTGKGAAGLGGALLAMTYLLRAVGDVGNGVLSWFSPMGWVQQSRAFANPRWWVLLLFVAAAIIGVSAAFVLLSHRDEGASLLPERLGRPSAKASLRSPLALAWRLQWLTLLMWSMGFTLTGLIVGYVAQDVRRLAIDNPQFSDALAKLGSPADIVDSYLAAIVGLFALVAAAYMVQSTMRLHTEERIGHGEITLAGAVSRARWAGSHLCVAVFGSAVLMVGSGLVIGLSNGLRSHDVAHQVWRLLGASLLQLPAIWAVGAVAYFAVAALPRFAVAGWVAFAGCLLISEFGALLQLSHWILDLSPFGHIPQLPLHDVSLVAVWVLLALAIIVVLAGFVGLRRRDIN